MLCVSISDPFPVAAAARRLIRQIGHLPISGREAAAFLGIPVVDLHGIPLRSGGIEPCGGSTVLCPETGECRIAINGGPDTGRRLNWTITHEVGHVALGHIRRPDYFAMTLRAVARLDREANAFAAELLMPTELVLHVESRWGPEKLARWCGVSSSAARIRIDEVRQNLDVLRDGGLDLVKLCRRPRPARPQPEPPWVRAILEFAYHMPRETEIQRIERELMAEEDRYLSMYHGIPADSGEGR